MPDFSNEELLILQKTREAVKNAKLTINQKNKVIADLQEKLKNGGSGPSGNSSSSSPSYSDKSLENKSQKELITHYEKKMLQVIEKAKEDRAVAVQHERDAVTKNLTTLKKNLEAFVKSKSLTEKKLAEVLAENERLRKGQGLPKAAVAPVGSSTDKETSIITQQKSIIQTALKNSEKTEQELSAIKAKLINFSREEANLKGALENQKKVIAQQSAVIHQNSWKEEVKVEQKAVKKAGKGRFSLLF